MRCVFCPPVIIHIVNSGGITIIYSEEKLTQGKTLEAQVSIKGSPTPILTQSFTFPGFVLVKAAGLTALEAAASCSAREKGRTGRAGGQWVYPHRVLHRAGGRSLGLEGTTRVTGDGKVGRIPCKNHDFPCTPCAVRHLQCLAAWHPVINSRSATENRCLRQNPVFLKLFSGLELQAGPRLQRGDVRSSHTVAAPFGYGSRFHICWFK